MHNRLLALPLTLLLLACVPGDGTIKIVGDANLGFDGIPVTPQNEFRVSTPDVGVTKLDNGGRLDTGVGPKLDTKPTPKPDTMPALCPPKGPFGTSKGTTASSFNNIPECGGTKHSLHPLCGNFKGFVIAMMSPS
jgi:hypothetical protein